MSDLDRYLSLLGRFKHKRVQGTPSSNEYRVDPSGDIIRVTVGCYGGNAVTFFSKKGNFVSTLVVNAK